MESKGLLKIYIVIHHVHGNFRLKSELGEFPPWNNVRILSHREPLYTSRDVLCREQKSVYQARGAGWCEFLEFENGGKKGAELRFNKM